MAGGPRRGIKGSSRPEPARLHALMTGQHGPVGGGHVKPGPFFFFEKDGPMPCLALPI